MASPKRTTSTAPVANWRASGAIACVTLSGQISADTLGHKKDFYNGYISTPAEMVSNATRQWISEANIFKAAVNQSNTFFPYYAL
ncbi:MAG: hypothetical protein FJY58_01570 [Betaproteobacteria bacterium]|nr:hypothetical protein [Betaproteobacteria bacterium]